MSQDNKNITSSFQSASDLIAKIDSLFDKLKGVFQKESEKALKNILVELENLKSTAIEYRKRMENSKSEWRIITEEIEELKEERGGLKEEIKAQEDKRKELEEKEKNLFELHRVLEVKKKLLETKEEKLHSKLSQVEDRDRAKKRMGKKLREL